MSSYASTATVQLDRLTLKQLRTEKEETYWGLLLFFAAQMALVVLLFLPLVLVGLLLVVCVQQLFLAYVRGNGVKITTAQFPDLHARIGAACKRLGIAKVPDAYVVQAGGTLNAMATKLLGRNFIIIYSELVEACGPEHGALDFVIGHELGHIALGHLKWAMWLLPARVVPLVGQAWSRACEYSCDRVGLVVARDLEAGSRGLAILAAGRTLGRSMSLAAFSSQTLDETRGFWAHIYELNASHPFLTKRVRALRDFMAPGSEPPVRRRFWAVVLAPLLGQPVAFVVGLVYAGIIGAAIGVPAYTRYQNEARQVEAKTALSQCRAAQQTYFAEHGRWGTSLDELASGSLTAPQAFTLSMGESSLGPQQDIPTGLRGYADAGEGFVCVALRNIDADDTWDVWVIDQTLAVPHHYVDDATDAVTDWRPAADEETPAEDE